MYIIIPFKSPYLIIVAISLSLFIAAIPIYHEANAKECNDSSCSDKQDSNSNSNSNDDNNNKHSNSNGDGSSATKDKTPFVLSTPVPFP